jgi:hypothetical protein
MQTKKKLNIKIIKVELEKKVALVAGPTRF